MIPCGKESDVTFDVMTGVHVRAAFSSFQVLTHLNLVQPYTCKECLVVFVVVSETVDRMSLIL
jgi:hypothetical protein